MNITLKYYDTDTPHSIHKNCYNIRIPDIRIKKLIKFSESFQFSGEGYNPLCSTCSEYIWSHDRYDHNIRYHVIDLTSLGLNAIYDTVLYQSATHDSYSAGRSRSTHYSISTMSRTALRLISLIILVTGTISAMIL
jgi:hypothetical protein